MANIEHLKMQSELKALIQERKATLPEGSMFKVVDGKGNIPNYTLGIVKSISNIGTIFSKQGSYSIPPITLEQKVTPLMIRGANITKFDCCRIPSDERDPNLHYYDVRHDDDCQGIACTIERRVWVNHLGTLVTLQPLPLDKDGYIELTEEESDFISGYL